MMVIVVRCGKDSGKVDNVAVEKVAFDPVVVL